MSAISTWFISIAGICILSVLVDLFLPDGSISSHIKSIFNFVIILVIITPLPNLIGQDFDASTIFTNQEIVLQEDYIHQLNRDKLTMLQNNIEATLENKGLENIKISISANIFTTQMEIERVYVDLENLVIMENGQHIDIKNEVIETITSFIDIKEENIIFDG